MEGGDWTQDLGSVSLMPDSALCAEDRINRVLLKNRDYGGSTMHVAAMR